MSSVGKIATWSAVASALVLSVSAIQDIRYSGEWPEHLLQTSTQNHTAINFLQQQEAELAFTSKPVSLFPQLDITLVPPTSDLSNVVDDANVSSSRIPLHPNSFEPTYFESSLFEGQVLLVFPHKDDGLKDSSADDMDDANEDKRQKYIDIQLQGRFKREPKGTIYFGVQFDARIGGWKKWIANMLFKLIQNFAPILFSYGNDKELPFVVSPLEYNAETYIATPSHLEPPQLGRSLKREHNIAKGSKFNTEDIYTFRFSNPCFDLVEWQFSLGDHKINLEDLLGTSSVSLIAYDNDESVAHATADDQYHMFLAQVQPFHERVHG